MEERDEFVNRTQGWVGVMTINRKGDEIASVVEPGGRVFLNAEEQMITARSHRRREDSPFVERDITHYDPMTGDALRTFRAPLLERVAPEAATPEPEPAPPRRSAPARRRKAATAVT